MCTAEEILHIVAGREEVVHQVLQLVEAVPLRAGQAQVAGTINSWTQVSRKNVLQNVTELQGGLARI